MTKVTCPVSYQVSTADGHRWRRHVDHLRPRVSPRITETDCATTMVPNIENCDSDDRVVFDTQPNVMEAHDQPLPEGVPPNLPEPVSPSVRRSTRTHRPVEQFEPYLS